MVLVGLGLWRVGGLGNLMTEFPDKFMMFHTTHDQCPILAYYICSIFVGAYYVSSNQFLMQRCLGARTHWDGRMGLLFSNYLKLLMPAIVVIPGIIAFKMFPRLSDPDQSYPLLAKELLAPGLFGLVMAAIAAAIMSTVSSAINSASTLVTMDLYVALARYQPSETKLVRVGKISSTILLILGVMFGLLYCSPLFQDPETRQPVAVFSLIMNIFFFIGPPLSIVFLTGIFWKRATPAAAVWTMVGGYILTLISQGLLFTPSATLPSFMRAVFETTPSLAELKNSIDHSYVIEHYNNFLYVAIWNGILSLILMISISLFTTPRPYGEISQLIWRPSVMRVDPDEHGGQGRTLSLVLWWSLCMALTAALYGYFAWFQLRHG
jgi:SSS family solute:Na+ symporter